MSREQEGMECLVNVVQELSLQRDLESVTRIVRQAARKLSGADGVTFVLRDQDTCHYVDEDAISPLWKGMRFAIDECISGWCMINRKPVTIADIYADERIPHEAYRPTFVKSLAIVPIRTINPLGAIGNYWSQHHVPTSREIRLLQSLADITAVAMENITLYQQLENRVRQRTAELESANQALADYSHSISHDLQAPLRSVKSLLEMMTEHIGASHDETLTRYANRMVNRIERMDAMIAGLLAFAKLGRQQLRCERVCMTGLVKEIVRDLNEQHSGRSLEFNLVLPFTDVTGDTLLLRQALTNILSNAVKYTSRKPRAVIEIGCEVRDRQVAYYVQDNGAGFDMEYANKLFGVFERMHSETEFDGLGIGLSLTKRIVERHGGEIRAEANLNQGARFTFTLPLHEPNRII